MTGGAVRRAALFRNAGYALPAIPLAALYFPVYVYIAPFYAAERGVGLASLGFLFIAVRLLDAVTDPLMGWISDRTPGRFGRRRPWLLVSAPLIALSVWMLMAPPVDAGFGHAAFWLTALTLSWTIALTPYFAWGAELSGDYGQRATITAWREGATLLGTVLAVILYNLAADAGAGLRAVAALVAAGLPLAVAAALLAAPEPRDYSRQRLEFRAGFRAVAASRYFRRLLLAYFVNGLANALPAGLFLFFIGDLLMTPDAGWLLLVYFVCAIAGLPFWNWAARRISKHRAWGLAMIWSCVAFLPAVLLGAGDAGLFAAVCVATGLALGADLALPAAIQADVVDADTAETGEQRTGLFFALWSVATKAALALSGGAALIILDLAGFEAGAMNAPSALFTLKALYALAPVALKLLAVALMWNFPLGEAQQKALRMRVEGGEN
ncbi:MFS transporter [Pikeienuella piscinae]|uniref:MFS transporter n=1 Tax=Pikeienuella piscinae TaxID=2748098 RepID=A0A7M3T772_9RHOB|nr:MFS transporter [Pikeienuella piscinae]